MKTQHEDDLVAAIMAVVRQEIDLAVQHIARRVQRLAVIRRQPMPGRSAGGIARAERLSPERRQEIAKLAATTRWGNAAARAALAQTEGRTDG